MNLTSLQLAAILKAGKAMVNADGVTKHEELIVLFNELRRFNVPEEDLSKLFILTDTMEVPEMFEVLSGIDDEAKSYVSAYLAAIMFADKDIDEKEIEVWKLICTLCRFPVMTIREALKLWMSKQ